MEILNVLAAAVASYIFGSIWYMTLAKPWMAASGVPVGEDGQPANRSNPIPYIIAFVAAVMIAGMMRHLFSQAGIDTFSKGLVSGLGIGLFLVTPWLATCYSFSAKSRKLILIDGGYATIGCTIMGVVLVLF